MAFVGWGWVTLLIPKSEWRPLIAQLLGMAIFLVVSSYVVYFNFQPISAVPIIVSLGIIGLILSWRRNSFRLPHISIFFKQGFWISVLAPIFVLYFETKDFFGSQFSYRLGPDNLGWATASSYLCRGNTEADLAASVQTQIGNTDLIESFNKPVLPGIFSVNRIPSYTDQVASEFLIGAHRTGGPGMVASLCQISGSHFFAAIFLAVICWSVLMIALLVRAFAVEKRLNPYIAVAIGLLTAINVNVLSVTFEGGFGQILTLPYFLAAVLWVSRPSFKMTNWVAISALLVVAAASTYLDVLYLAAPFILGTLLIRVLVWKDVKFVIEKRTFVIALLTLVSILPILPHVYRLAIGPILRPAQGGWDQGNFPLLDNVLGIASRLPHGATTGLESRTTEVWVFDVVLSIAVIVVFAFTFPKISLPFFPIVLGYGVLIYSIYFTSAEVINNYRIWKYSEYSAVFFSIVIIDALAKYWGTKKNSKKKQSSNKPGAPGVALLVVVVSLLGVQLSASIIWAVDWKQSSKVTLSAEGAEVLKPYIEKYDIQVVCGAFPTDYSIVGDIRYVDSTRGAGPVERSQPDREKILLIPAKSFASQKCVNEYLPIDERLLVEYLERNSEFQLISTSP